MLDWKKLEQHTKAIGYRTLVFKTFAMPDGSRQEFSTYGRIDFQGAAIIALTADNKVLIARQFRPGPEAIMDELPGGTVDAGEDIETTAQRELLEETGYRAARLDYLGLAYRDAYSNETTHYFIGYDCLKIAEQTTDPAEFIKVTTISVEQLLQNARLGKMTDTPAVLMAYSRLIKLAKS